MAYPFPDSTSIANRALQKLGALRIAAGTLFTSTSKSAVEAAACYDALRLAELSRNTWRFAIRRAILRPIGTPFPNWDSTVTYIIGSYVTDGGTNYVSLVNSNLNIDPTLDNGTHWSIFNGNTSLQVTFPTWSNATTYAQGAVAVGSDGLIYQSMLAGNIGHDPTTDNGTNWQLYFESTIASAYDSTTSYFIGELVFDVNNVIYASTMNGNENAPSTGEGWLTISGATSAPVYISWPAGTGPMTDDTSRNVFVLPNGYLRRAPDDPTAGRASLLGFPSNIAADDYVFEGNYLTSFVPDALMVRFVADVSQVSKMHVMFCEGLACRIAYELCEILTNSGSKLVAIGGQYKLFMNEARAVDAVQQGPIEPPLDDYIACRL